MDKEPSRRGLPVHRPGRPSPWCNWKVWGRRPGPTVIEDVRITGGGRKNFHCDGCQRGTKRRIGCSLYATYAVKLRHLSFKSTCVRFGWKQVCVIEDGRTGAFPVNPDAIWRDSISAGSSDAFPAGLADLENGLFHDDGLGGRVVHVFGWRGAADALAAKLVDRGGLPKRRGETGEGLSDFGLPPFLFGVAGAGDSGVAGSHC